MAASAERKRAGFVLADRLWVGLYGETFRAAGAGRRDLHALIVDRRIAGEEGVAAALLDEAVPALRSVHHRAIVGTVAAVQDAGDLVVVTEEVPESVTLHELLAACRAHGLKIPPEVAATIGRAIIDAAATAHAAGVVHGAIHPRSILIDGEGSVRVADFAIARAVVAAVSRDASPELLRGLGGYLAHDIAVGDAPTPASDVYALGAVMFVMLTGELPPGSLHSTPAIERLVQRALDGDLTRRFGSAVELQENLAEALEDDRWHAATQVEVARFVARARKDDALDAQTEDLLASLGAGLGDAPTRDAIDLSSFGGDSQVSGVSGVSTTGTSLESVIADLDDGDEPLTEVDGAQHALRGEARDPISEMLALDRARTGEPLIAEVEPPRHRSGERARRVGSKDPARRGSTTGDQRAAEAAISSLDEPSEVVRPPPAARPATAIPPPALDDAPIPALRSTNRLTNLVWLIVLLAAGAALVWVIMDLRDKGRQQAAANEERKREAEEKERQLEAELADPGAIVVASDPGEAAVWLLLGRTPTDSLPLPTGQLHELRLELDGYQPVDLAVTAKDWTGTGNARRASVSATLEPGTPSAPPPPMPVWPEGALADLQRGLSVGRGVIHVESQPAGAAVWLLVGKTNQMRLEGIEAGRDYELKVVKAGYTPGYVHIKAEEWRQGGDPRLPLSAAPKHAVLERTVELVEAPAPKKER